MTLDEIERYRALQQEILDIGYAMLGDRPKCMPVVSREEIGYVFQPLPRELWGHDDRWVEGLLEARRFLDWDGT